MSKKYKSYKNMSSYQKDNLKYIDRYGDPRYKRHIKKCIVNRYGDVVKVITKQEVKNEPTP